MIKNETLPFLNTETYLSLSCLAEEKYFGSGCIGIYSYVINQVVLKVVINIFNMINDTFKCINLNIKQRNKIF